MHVLQRAQGRGIESQGAFQNLARARALDGEAGELRGLIFQLDRVGDDVVVQLLPDDFEKLRLAVEQESFCVEPQHARVGQDVPVRVEHERGIAVADFEALDFVADHAVQEARRVFAADHQPSAVRQVQQARAFVQRPVLVLDGAKRRRDLPAVVVHQLRLHRGVLLPQRASHPG